MVPISANISTTSTILVQFSHKNSKSLEIYLEKKSQKILLPNPPFFKKSYKTPISSNDKNKME
jgi:hypothetical protein